MNNKTNVGLFGLGCVGHGFYDLYVRHPEININTKRVVVKHKEKKRDVSNGTCISFDDNDILNDPEIKILVEAINNTEDALAIARHTLSKGKTLVSASKKMIAENLKELVDLQQKNNSRLLYEASSAGSIPIIRILEEYFSNEKIFLFEGILNGTSNFILTRIFNDYSNYDATIKLAQEKGFAESDPTLDVEGYDALNKLVIIVAHAFGTIIHPDKVFSYGITSISDSDVQYAMQHGWKIKQVARAKINDDGKIVLFVAPKFVKSGEQLYHVDEENNGIIIHPEFSGPQFYYGKGAGSHPTGSAVMADVVAALTDFQYRYKKLHTGKNPDNSYEENISVYLRYPNSFDISGIQFTSITSHLTGYSSSTVFGTIPLAQLMRHKELMQKNNVSLIFF